VGFALKGRLFGDLLTGFALSETLVVFAVSSSLKLICFCCFVETLYFKMLFLGLTT
jgi:hypothetical protein